MSITITITVIAASLVAGTIIGKRQQDKRGIRPIADDIDDCITVYASEQSCECMDDHLLEVTTNMRGLPVCTNCGRRRI